MQKSAGFLILNSFFFNDVVEQFATWSVFHNKKQLSASFNNLVELDYVRMPNDFENLNFTHHPGNIGLLLDFVFLENFDRNLFLGDLVNAHPNLPKSTLSYSFA